MKRLTIVALIILAAEVVFLLTQFMASSTKEQQLTDALIVNVAGEELTKTSLVEQGYKVATFAGGCFWCSEAEYANQPGVIQVVSGYAGGGKPNPTYQEVYSGGSGYREAIQIVYDPTKTSYETLVDIYWKHIDPTDAGGQFADRGFSYTTAIYYHDEEQQAAAQASKEALSGSWRYQKPIVTQVVAFTTFYPAEDSHQDYSEKHPFHYLLYKKASGREAYLKETWGDEA